MLRTAIVAFGMLFLGGTAFGQSPSKPPEPPQIVALDFAGGVVLHDLDYAPVPRPQYLRDLPEGRTRNYAVAYVRGTQGTVTVTLEDPVDEGFSLQARLPDSNIVVVAPSGYAPGAVTQTHDVVVPGEIMVTYDLLWEARRPREPWQPLERLRSPICVLREEPAMPGANQFIDERYTRVLEFVAWWSTEWLATDPRVPDDPSDIQVMEALARNRHRAHKFDDTSHPIIYDHVGGSLGDTAALIRHGIGLCGDWSNFFINLGRTQGVTDLYHFGFTLKQILPPPIPGEALWFHFWITAKGMNHRRWHGVNRRHSPSVPPCLITETGRNYIAKAYELERGADQRVPAQELTFCWEGLPSNDPLKENGGNWWQFGNHAIVLHDTTEGVYVYDPSFANDREIILERIPPLGRYHFRAGEPGWDFVEGYFKPTMYAVTGYLCVRYPDDFEEGLDVAVSPWGLDEFVFESELGRYH